MANIPPKTQLHPLFAPQIALPSSPSLPKDRFAPPPAIGPGRAPAVSFMQPVPVMSIPKANVPSAAAAIEATGPRGPKAAPAAVSTATMASRPPLPSPVSNMPSIPGVVTPMLPSVATVTRCSPAVSTQHLPYIAPTSPGRPPRVRPQPTGPVEIPCGRGVPSGVGPPLFMAQQSSNVAWMQGMGLSGLEGLGALGGEWEDWCDNAAKTWASVTGNSAEAEKYRLMCRREGPDYDKLSGAQKLVAMVQPPWTVAGLPARGLPVNWSGDPNTVSKGAGASLIDKIFGTAKDVQNVFPGGKSSPPPPAMSSSGGGTSSSSYASTGTGSNEMSTGMKVGIAAAGVAAIGGLGYLFFRKRRKNFVPQTPRTLAP